MIVFDKVTKYFPTKFGAKYVVRDFSMTFPAEQNVALIGPNGSGKSTFINLLAGTTLPTTGRIRSDESISWPLGLAGGFQGSLTGRQNAKFVARVYGIPENDLAPVVDFVGEFSEIGNYFDLPVNAYSNGMRSRVAFGLSMAFNFETLLIDELTSVGDMGFRDKAKHTLLDKKGQSRVFMASHNLNELRDICDAGIVFGDGQARFFDDIDEAISDYAGEETLSRLEQRERRKSRALKKQARIDSRMKKRSKRRKGMNDKTAQEDTFE